MTSPSAGQAAVNPRQQSIARRVVRLVLVPSVVALLIWFAASGYLVFQGFYNRAVANSVRQVSIPAVVALSSVQQERRLSVAYLARPSNGLTALLDRRRQTDQQVDTLRRAADGALGQAPQSIKDRWTELTGYLDRLATTRSAIDARTMTGREAYAFYNSLLDAATDLFDNQARVVPDVTATQGGIAATEVFRASDLMSRAGSLIDGALASGPLSRADHLEFVRLVGAYHFALTSNAPHVEPAVRTRYAEIEASPEWKQLTQLEGGITAGGPWAKRVSPSLGVGVDRWSQLTAAVSGDLIDLTVRQADQVSARTLRTGNTQLLTATLGSLLALAVALGAILWAVRQSRVLVDRALSVRLARLGSDAGTLVDQRLPAVMERLRRREQVDLATEFAAADYGGDEIGQVARVINRSLQAAAGAAVDEAKARTAGTAMLMGVARRPQRPLQRGLKVVEDLQAQVGDEKLLTNLFDIHHQLNQTRRFLENLVILAGGQIGRRFPKPVALRRVLLASFAEARNYQRITLRRADDVSLAGHAVAEVIHLLAELLDNALAFSPPDTTVWVTSSRVQHGVAIEIEDAGVGMSAEAVDRANTLLATAPTPDVTELRDGAQIGLHVVAELAKREGVQISLRRSAYGGLLAIVLLPERILVGADNDSSGDPRDMPIVPAAQRAEPARPAPAEPEAQPVRAAVGVLEPVAEKPVKPTSGKPPLPHRRPQQHLAPELLDADEEEDTAAIPVRSPEEARQRFARYQRGWAEGAAADRNDDENTTDAEQGGNA
ncbi:sensor histidine kinase [Paractinoplanes hotanensis]|uniref:histidine kinase n=1 Tax=Paractinoplanes hotanensis TaxID=2906497 RepID=A0ABT0XSB5_9ACTN|nr:nitrate- and nitrite sensing domain-containing protein [Actinoplanes hotanensis]MCM4076632.1 nitrate- and nitrite sensing domain-containing protein [Actinoplanes hotanensis]